MTTSPLCRSLAGILKPEEAREFPWPTREPRRTPDAPTAIPEKLADVQFGVDWFNFPDITR
jgi:hypothetical protein